MMLLLLLLASAAVVAFFILATARAGAVSALAVLFIDSGVLFFISILVKIVVDIHLSILKIFHFGVMAREAGVT